MTKSESGLVAELLFAARIIELGYHVLWPGRADSHYDLVVDNGKTRIRVQVKSNNQFNNEWRVRVRQGSGKRIRPYRADSLDVIAIYLFRWRRWYLIPFAELSATGNVQGSKWAKFRENWKLLKGD